MVHETIHADAGRDRVRALLDRLGLLRSLRAAKRRVRSRLDGSRLERRVLAGYRLVPEEPLTRCCRDALSLLAAQSVGQPIGDYLEFGVCHGASLACMHRASADLGFGDMRLFGFDSFAGLPPSAEDEANGGVWHEGQYRSNLRFTRRFLTRAGVDWRRVVLVKGWFEDTLTADLVARHGIRRAAIIMIDCDLYTSACEALRFCRSLIKGQAAIYFDDWHAGGDLAARAQGERRAFEEFLAADPQLEAAPLPSYTANAKGFLLTRRGDAPVEHRPARP